MPGGLAVISVGLLAASAAPALVMRRRYGRRAGARFAAGSMLAMLAQQSLVGVAASRTNASLSAVDAMTLSRGVASAVLVGLLVSGVRCRNGLAGWLGWGSLVYGSIVCDWLDGPIARRVGATSELGAGLDLESDSWLTLAASPSAAPWGGLPGYCRAAPLARYALGAAAIRRIPYARIYADEPPWARPFGIAQMALFMAATAPFGAAPPLRPWGRPPPLAPPPRWVGILPCHRRSHRTAGA